MAEPEQSPVSPAPPGAAGASPADPDQAALAQAKQVLRRAVALRRAARPAAQRERDDLARLDVLAAALGESPPATVAAYLSTGEEPGTLPLVAWLAARDVRVLLPVLSRGRAPAWAAYAGPGRLRAGRLGIVEPDAEPLPPDALASAGLVLAPALAIDRVGTRLGRGGGWYDRALAHRSAAAPVWGLVNADELLTAVPAQPWDAPVDAALTPGGLVPLA